MSNNLKGLYWAAFLDFHEQSSFGFEPSQYLLHAIFALTKVDQPKIWEKGVSVYSKFYTSLSIFSDGILHIYLLT